jgi:hypothetical protein
VSSRIRALIDISGPEGRFIARSGQPAPKRRTLQANTHKDEVVDQDAVGLDELE